MTTGTEQEPARPRAGREGNRWVNERPDGAEFADWFASVQIHEKLYHDEFLGGITLIQQVEKSDTVLGFDADGKPQIGERKDLVYVPYARVDTRIAYFWALMRENPQWLGSIVPVTTRRQADDLPPGFFRTTTQSDHGKIEFACCTYKVEIIDRVSERPVGVYPAGTKAVPLYNKYDIDPHAYSRAETGAVGRALGMAGMLVIPGSGVATAEDVQDAVAPMQNLRGPAAPAALPPDANPSMDDEASLREAVANRLAMLKKLDPKRLEQFQEWLRGRNLGPFEAMDGAALKILVKRLDKELDSAPQVVEGPDEQ